MAVYYGDLPKPDNLGRWRPVVGVDCQGKPQRFQVGNKKHTSETDAKRRLDAVRDLYARQCKELSISYWASWVLDWALKMARGIPISVSGSDYSRVNAGQAAEELAIAEKLRKWGVPIQIIDPALITSGVGFFQEQINEAVAVAMAKINGTWGKEIVENYQGVASPDNLLVSDIKTLHEALDARGTHIRETGQRDARGNLTSFMRKCIDRLGYLKIHENMPLWKLDLPAIEKVVSYWQNRPMTHKGNRCSIDHAKAMLKEFFRFLRWLDTTPAYKWTMPHGTDKINRSPIDLPEDTRQTGFNSIDKPTYTPEQLAILVQNTDDFGKAIIGVCVNCAFGASEIGQWATKNYLLHKVHPHADKIGIVSSTADSWIVGHRPKTGCYGEHLLWQEVADAVAPFLDGREVLPINSKSTPWFRTTANPQAPFAKWFSDLLDKVKKKHLNFPRLPFGSLRDLLPDILRRDFSDEIASICLQHGKTSDDDLLKCYANTPFKKLFNATRELEAYFRPFLNALDTPTESNVTK
jgi:hypothetical protein